MPNRPVPGEAAVEVDINVPAASTEGFGCFRPSDCLRGELRMSSKAPLRLDRAEIYLRGKVAGFTLIKLIEMLCWSRFADGAKGVQSVISVASDMTRRSTLQKILDVMYHPSLPGDIEAKRTGSTHIYSVPFLYIVPDGTEFPDDNEFPTSCRPLPPSTTGTFFYTNTWNALLQPHVNIQYFIKAIVTYSQRTPTTSSATTTAVVTRPIDLLPYNDVPPPVNIHSYPGEFTETIQRPIRASYIGEQLGSVTAKAGEPPPLTYMAGVKEVSTDCILRISIQGAKIDPRRLGHITVEVYPILHAKTYFSLQQMQCMPSRCSIADDGPQLYETLMRLNIQKFRDFQWSSSVPIPRDQAHIEQQTSTAPAVDGTSHGRQPADTSRKCFQSRFTLPWVQMEALPSEQRVTTWQTTVRVPIYPPQRLHPSFCSTLAARSYSIELQIRIYGGLYTGKMRLEVPLQVAYPRPSAARPGDAPFQFAPDDLELGNSDTDNGTSRMRSLPSYDEITR